MSPEVRRPLDIIVYQFGKVGSTSVVRSLAAVEGCSVHQSHFLGEKALKEKVVALLDPRANPFFVVNGEKQLMENIRLTRLFHAHRLGLQGERRLIVVSMSREPLDWFRSQVIQEWAGYEHGFAVLAGRDSAAELVQADFERALDAIRSAAKEAAQVCGHVDSPEFMGRFWWDYAPQLRARDPASAPHLIAHVSAFLRPLLYFRVQFAPLFGFSVFDLSFDGALMRREADWGRFYLFRYEDLRVGFQQLVTDLGLGKCLPGRERQ